MPGPTARAVENLVPEILAPRPACHSTIVCDCCRRARSADNFGEDCFGICSDCIDSDALLVELDPSIALRPSAHS